MINVWGSWCPGCNAEAADLARFARSHADVQVVGVDTQDSSSAAKSFYRKWGWRHANQYGNVYGSGRGDLPASLPRIALPLDPSQVEPAPREYVA